jgi:thioredoxin-like negative regulator of GroEL
MRVFHCALIAASLVATTTAIARDHLGYTAIQAGDFSTAERIITAERRIYPRMPELMLNLAVVYAHTGRAAEARALYRDVLGQPEVMLDTPSASVSSYAVAKAGLAQPTLASN